MTDDLEAMIDGPFVLRHRSRPVAGDLRTTRRVSLLLLIVNACWGKKATLEQLHVLDWALRSDQARESFLRFVAGELHPDRVLVRYDPSLSRAVQIAVCRKLLCDRERQSREFHLGESSNSYRVELTEIGGRVVAALHEAEDALCEEKAFLSQIGRKVTQRMVTHLLKP